MLSTSCVSNDLTWKYNSGEALVQPHNPSYETCMIQVNRQVIFLLCSLKAARYKRFKTVILILLLLCGSSFWTSLLPTSGSGTLEISLLQLYVQIMHSSTEMLFLKVMEMLDRLRVHQCDEVPTRKIAAFSYFYDRAVDAGILKKGESAVVQVMCRISFEWLN